MQKYKLVFEKVVVSSDAKHAYTIPSFIDDARVERDLLNAIESDNHLKGIILHDRFSDVFKDTTAEDMWLALNKHPVAEDIKARAKQQGISDIEKYRIGVVRVGSPYLKKADDAKSDFHKFDNWLNSLNLSEIKKAVPSFRQYVDDIVQYRPDIVSGAATKSRTLF